jgi:hypothetical protein
MAGTYQIGKGMEGIIQQNYKIFSYISCLPGQDLNPKYPEYVPHSDVSSTVAKEPNSPYVTHS